MSTVHETAALLPDPTELRVHLRALAVLDATIGDDPQFVEYVFDPDWGPDQEAALMDNGSGDDFSVLFTPAGVLIRGFDHESAMSPYGTDDEEVWPGVVDEVPVALRPSLDDAAFTDAYLGVTRVTACLWRETGDTAWRTGSAIDFPPGNAYPDGSDHLFRLLTDRSPRPSRPTSRTTTSVPSLSTPSATSSPDTPSPRRSRRPSARPGSSSRTRDRGPGPVAGTGDRDVEVVAIAPLLTGRQGRGAAAGAARTLRLPDAPVLVEGLRAFHGGGVVPRRPVDVVRPAVTGDGALYVPVGR